MQTFLPHDGLGQSAAVLDNSRLHNQVNEALVIAASALRLKRVGEEYVKVPKWKKVAWENHPAVKMWVGYVSYLSVYIEQCMNELAKRKGYGSETRLRDPIRWARTQRLWEISCSRGISRPHWFGNEDFHRSHQSNLIRKLPEHYAPLFPGVPDNLPYVWPTGCP
jgi:Pyrimidine dimer DNA glycosylase